jgi:hypothetical protein
LEERLKIRHPEDQGKPFGLRAMNRIFDLAVNDLEDIILLTEPGKNVSVVRPLSSVIWSFLSLLVPPS